MRFVSRSKCRGEIPVELRSYLWTPPHGFLAQSGTSSKNDTCWKFTICNGSISASHGSFAEDCRNSTLSATSNYNSIPSFTCTIWNHISLILISNGTSLQSCPTVYSLTDFRIHSDQCCYLWWLSTILQGPSVSQSSTPMSWQGVQMPSTCADNNPIHRSPRFRSAPDIIRIEPQEIYFAGHRHGLER